MARLPLSLAALAAVLAATGCVEPEDEPSNVHDLRVLGMAFEPPELMAPDCSQLLTATATLDTPLEMRALIIDPFGEGRPIEYDVAACADPDDPTCTEDPEQRVELERGTLQEEDWSTTVTPGPAILQDGTPLLVRVFENDPFRGLGGLRLPVVLHLRAGEEEVYANKLMVFSCKIFPDYTPNVTPQLPGLQLGDAPWPVDPPPAVQGTSEVRLAPDPIDALQEAYVVPSFSLSPVHLTESWRISWYTTLGTIAPLTTGGVDVGGEEGRHEAIWTPPSGADPQTVRFFIVVRDGRGGESWEQRAVQFQP